MTGVTLVSIPPGNRGAVRSREADFANRSFGRPQGNGAIGGSFKQLLVSRITGEVAPSTPKHQRMHSEYLDVETVSSEDYDRERLKENGWVRSGDFDGLR